MIKIEQYEKLEETIAFRQRQIASLQAEIAELQRVLEPKGAPRYEVGVKIMCPRAVLPTDYPNESEFDALNRIVGARYPRLAYAAADSAARRQFANAFLYLFFARRRDKPNTAYALSYWVDSGRQWLRRQSIESYFTASALVAGAILHGVGFTEPPYSSLGLTLGEHTEARKSAWRDVLASGQCPNPVRR
jgi:hypothetical protein